MASVFIQSSGGGGSGVDTNTYVVSGSVSGNNLILTKSDFSTINVDVSTLVGGGSGTDTNTYVSSGSVSGNNLTLTMSDSSNVVIDVSTLVGGSSGGGTDTNTYVLSGSVSGNNLTLTNNDSTTINVDVSSLTIDNNTALASGNVSGNTLTLTNSDSTTIDVDVSSLNAGGMSTTFTNLANNDLLQYSSSSSSWENSKDLNINTLTCIDGNTAIIASAQNGLSLFGSTTTDNSMNGNFVVNSNFFLKANLVSQNTPATFTQSGNSLPLDFQNLSYRVVKCTTSYNITALTITNDIAGAQMIVYITGTLGGSGLTISASNLGTNIKTSYSDVTLANGESAVMTITSDGTTKYVMCSKFS